MKRLVSILFAVLALGIFGTSANAQKNDKEKMSREELAESQAKYIAGQLKLDDVVTKRFTKTYCDFQEDLWKLGPRTRNDKSNLTDEETKKALEDRFDHSQKLLDLRKEYYEKYSDFLAPKQIDQLYEIERKMMNRLSDRPHGRPEGRR